LKNVENNISKIPGNIGKIIQENFQAVIKKNNGYETLKKISACIDGTNGTLENIEQNFSPNDVSLFKYAPVTSIDVERSFSRFKNVLADNRRTFTFENLKKTFVVQCNATVFGMYLFMFSHIICFIQIFLILIFQIEIKIFSTQIT
jgi:hypothetical protein